MTVGPQVDDFLGDHFKGAFPDLFDDVGVFLTAQVARVIGDNGIERSFEVDLPMIRTTFMTRLRAVSGVLTRSRSICSVVFMSRNRSSISQRLV